MQRDLVGKEHPVAALSKQQHFGRVEGESICCSCLMAKWARESSVQEPLKDQTFGNKVEEGFGGSTTAAAKYRDSQGNPTTLKRATWVQLFSLPVNSNKLMTNIFQVFPVGFKTPRPVV